MEEAAIQQRLKELAGDVEFKDVLSAPKEHKIVNIDTRKLEVEKAEKTIAKRKEEERSNKILEEANEIIHNNDDFDDDDEVFDADDSPKVLGDLSLTTESAMTIYELIIQILNEWAKKQTSGKMTDEDKYRAAYLLEQPKEDLDPSEKELIGMYLHFERENVKLIEENELTPKDKELAEKALRTLFDSNGKRIDPVWACVAVLGKQIGSRVGKIYFT